MHIHRRGLVGVLISSHLRFSLDNVSLITERMAVKIPRIALLTLMQGNKRGKHQRYSFGQNITSSSAILSLPTLKQGQKVHPADLLIPGLHITVWRRHHGKHPTPWGWKMASHGNWNYRNWPMR